MHYRGVPHREVSSFSSFDPSYNGDKAPRRSSVSSYAIPLILLSCFVTSGDQLMAAPNLSQIANDFGLSPSERDSYLGALAQFGFYISAGVFSIIAGPVVEVIDRSKLLGVLCAFSGILSCCTSLLPYGRGGFVYYLLIRCLAGIPFGVIIPTAFSFVADLVVPAKRTTMGALVSTSSTAGAGIGQAIAGLIGGSWIHSWRLPYFILCLFAFICSFIVVIFLEDKHRSSTVSPRGTFPSRNESAGVWGGSDGPKKGTLRMEDLNWSNFTTVLRSKTNRLIFAQSVPGCIASSCIGTFLPDYIHNDLGLSLASSTGVMIIFGLSGLVFSMLGSAYGQSLYNGQRAQLPQFITTMTITGAVPMILLVVVNGGMWNSVFAAMGGAVAAAGPNLRGILMNANPSDKRGSVFSLFNLVDSIGKGIGPSMLVLVTMIFSGNRTVGFVVVFSFWFIAAAIQKQLETCFVDDTLAVEIKSETTDTTKEPFDLLHIFHGNKQGRY